MNFNRRDFFKKVGVAAAAAGVMGVAPAFATETKDKKEEKPKTAKDLRDEYIVKIHQELPKGEVTSYKTEGNRGFSYAQKTDKDLFIVAADEGQPAVKKGEKGRGAKISVLYKKGDHDTNITLSNFPSGLIDVQKKFASEIKIAKKGKGRPILKMEENGVSVNDPVTKIDVLTGLSKGMKSLAVISGADSFVVTGQPKKGNVMNKVHDGMGGLKDQMKSMDAAWVRSQKAKTL